ncbi:MAG: efflux RND transporter periplasmic adaptor subunit [Chitinophagaceae bacterium]|jgi:membrane fusion protein (multidrug efflux system)|nr:efflux RND transporter periplasmic adaptor subunit [Chitinophagaceae bacterium]
MQNKIRWWVLGTTTMILLASCGGSQQQAGFPQGGPVVVKMDTVKETNAVFYDEYPCIVTALKEVQLTSQVSGYVTGIYFKDGDRVSAGQKLYTIDAQIYDANLKNAEANVAVQEANLNLAQKNATRYHELDAQDAIAKQLVDEADAALAAAQKQVAAARATVNSLHANVKFSIIYAPFSGTIGISQVRVGAAVVAGQSLLNTVSTDNPVAVDFPINQKQIYHFLQMQEKGAENDSTFKLVFGTDVYPYSGKISLIDRAVDPQTGTIKVRLIFPNDKNLLRSGMNGVIRVATQATAGATKIPYKAVVEQLGDFNVYVVGDSNKVSLHKIQLGSQVGKDVIIESGLKAGDKIVIEGQQNIRAEGTKVTDAPPHAPKK